MDAATLQGMGANDDVLDPPAAWRAAIAYLCDAVTVDAALIPLDHELHDVEESISGGALWSHLRYDSQLGTMRKRIAVIDPAQYQEYTRIALGRTQ